MQTIKRLLSVWRSLFSKWQPIETAPKDGTPILLKGGDTGELEDYYDDSEPVPPKSRRPVVAQWVPPRFDGDDGWWGYAYWDGGWRSGYENPKQWRPLPE